jgi:hypothetical protein
LIKKEAKKTVVVLNNPKEHRGVLYAAQRRRPTVAATICWRLESVLALAVDGYVAHVGKVPFPG